MGTATFTRLMVDAEGHSYFEDHKIRMAPTDFAPPAPPLDFAAVGALAGGFVLGADKDWAGDAPHPAPRRQILVVMQGTVELTSSRGETRRFGPGQALWLEDTHGHGHQTRIPDDGTTVVFGAALADAADGDGAASTG